MRRGCVKGRGGGGGQGGRGPGAGGGPGGLEVSCERDTRTFLCFSRQVHRESKLVNVKEAIAVNVREVPHLRGEG